MLAKQSLLAFVAVTDGVAARKFYEGTLGLEVLFDDDFALVVKAKNANIRMQKLPQLSPQQFTVLGWEVDDVSATVDRLAERGVTCQRYPGMEQDARGIWTAPSGARVAWFKDPSGNTLSVNQV